MAVSHHYVKMSNIILSEINKLASKKENNFKFKKALKVIKSRETIINERMKSFLLNGKKDLLDFDKFYKEKTTI